MARGLSLNIKTPRLPTVVNSYKGWNVTLYQPARLKSYTSFKFNNIWRCHISHLKTHGGPISQADIPHVARAYPFFCSIKRLQNFMFSPLDGMLVHQRVMPNVIFISTCLHRRCSERWKDTTGFPSNETTLIQFTALHVQLSCFLYLSSNKGCITWLTKFISLG